MAIAAENIAVEPTVKLSVAIIGGFTASVGPKLLAGWGRKTQALLAILVMSRTGCVSREGIQTLLWSGSDEARARGSLRNALYEARAILDAEGCSAILADKNNIAIDLSMVEVDLHFVLSSISQSPIDPRLSATRRLMRQVLAGFDDIDPQFAGWLHNERLAAQATAIRLLEAELAASHSILRGCHVAENLLAIEPTHEASARFLIASKSQNGDIGGALNIYKELWKALEDEFDIEPSVETTQLIGRIRTEQGSVDGAITSPQITHSRPTIERQHRGCRRPILKFTTMRLEDGLPAHVGSGIAGSILHALSAPTDVFDIIRDNAEAHQPAPTAQRTYELSCSIMRDDEQLRVTTELVDCASGNLLHVARHDGPQSSLFQLLDTLSLDITGAVAPRIRRNELALLTYSRPEQRTSYQLVLSAFDLMHRLDSQAFAAARQALETAVRIDPDYAPAKSYLAWWYGFRLGQGWSTEPSTDADQALELAYDVLRIDETDVLARTVCAQICSFARKDYDTALHHLDLALKVSPNFALAWTIRAATLGFVGDVKGAIENALTGQRLAPLDKSAYFAKHILSQSHLIAGDYANAQKWARFAYADNGNCTSNIRGLIVASEALGRTREARAAAERHRAIAPTFAAMAWAERTPLDGVVSKQWLGCLQSAGL